MSEILEGERKRCNDACIQLWKYTDLLREEIQAEKNQDRKNALEQHRWLIGAIADLYYLHASVRAHLQQTNDLVEVIRAEVFGQRNIRLPHQPQNDATIAETVRRYQEKEPTLNWVDRELKERAKETERKEGSSNNTSEGVS